MMLSVRDQMIILVAHHAYHVGRVVLRPANAWELAPPEAGSRGESEGGAKSTPS